MKNKKTVGKFNETNAKAASNKFTWIKKLTIQTDGKYLDQAQTGQPNKCKESRAGPSQ